MCIDISCLLLSCFLMEIADIHQVNTHELQILDSTSCPYIFKIIYTFIQTTYTHIQTDTPFAKKKKKNVHETREAATLSSSQAGFIASPRIQKGGSVREKDIYLLILARKFSWTSHSLSSDLDLLVDARWAARQPYVRLSLYVIVERQRFSIVQSYTDNPYNNPPLRCDLKYICSCLSLLCA